MKKAIFVVIVIVLLATINGLAHSIYDLWHKQDLVTSAKQQLDTEKFKNQKLKGELSYVKSPQFIDEEAHNKLFLVKPGEQEVLISQKLTQEDNAAKPASNVPNWQQWLKLFF